MSEQAVTTSSAHEMALRARVAKAIEVHIDAAWDVACHVSEAEAWDYLAGHVIAAARQSDVDIRSGASA